MGLTWRLGGSMIPGIVASRVFQATFAGIWTALGSSFAAASGNPVEVCELNATDIAYIDAGTDALRTYRFNGSTWSQVGNALALSPAPVTPKFAMARLSATRIAIADSDITRLQAYYWDGTYWVKVGTQAYPGVTVFKTVGMTGLNSTDIALIHETDTLETWSFNGSTWSKIGNGLSVPDFVNGAGAGLTSSTIALIPGYFNPILRTYSWNGTNWTTVGNGLDLGAASINVVRMTALTPSRVAVHDVISDTLRAYDWDGTDWSQIGASLSVVNTGLINGLASLTSNTVAHVNANILQTYKLT